MIKVLLIAEDDISAKSLKYFLEESGYLAYIISPDPAKVLKYAAISKPDIVLMDVDKVGITEILTTAGKIRKELFIPVVFIVSDEDMESYENVRSFEPEGFLLKPLNGRAIKINIELALYKHETEKRLRDTEHRLAETLINFQMRSEELLHDREQKYRTLFEQSPSGIYLTNPKGRLIDINPALAAMIGYDNPTEAFLAIHDVSTDIFSDQQSYKERVAKLDSPGISIKFESDIKRKDGSLFIGNVFVKAIYNRNNLLQYHIGHIEDITEHRILKDAYFSVVDHSSQGIAIFQGESIVFTNIRFSEITGYPDLKKINTHRNGLAELLLKKVNESPYNNQFEYDYIDKSGEKYCLEVYTGKMIYNRKPAIQVTIQDKTERKRIEELQSKYIQSLETLSESAINMVGLTIDDNIYQAISDNLTNMIKGSLVVISSYSDTDGLMKLEAVSGHKRILKQIETLLGREFKGLAISLKSERRKSLLSGKLLNVPIKEYIAGLEGIKKFPPHVDKFIEKTNIYSMGLVRSGKLYGNIAILSVDSSELPDLNVIETYIHMSSVALQRKFAEEALLESEKRLAIALNSTPIVVFTTDINHRFTWVYNNKNSIRLDDIIGKTADEVNLGGRFKAVYNLMNRAITNKERVSGEISIDYNNQEYYLDLYIEPAYDRQGVLIGTIGVAIDITERKLFDDEILRLNQDLLKQAAYLSSAYNELESFSFSVSHDLRAPLRSISGFSKIILEEYGKTLDMKGQDYFKKIINAANNMGLLIDDLINLARISRTELIYENFNFTDLVNDLASELSDLNSTRNIKFNIQENIFLYGDRNLFGIAVRNLLDNSIKFTKNNDITDIEIGMTEINGENWIYVKDNGVGFDMKYTDKLFMPFQRIHSNTEFPGTGIGLAIVNKIIQRHNGKIWAEGEINKGCTFYFLIK